VREGGRGEPSITKGTIRTKEWPHQVGGEAVAEAHLSIHIACTMGSIQTTAPKIAQYS
jgi:hypothetical protein